MAVYQLGEVEARFADIVWQNEPLTTNALIKLCSEQLQWNKSTTYTVLKRLCDKGLFQYQKSIVTAKLTKDEFRAAKSEQFIEKNFGGSLPAFLVAFASRKQLTPETVQKLREMIEEYSEK